MGEAYFHSEEVVVRAAARRCYELVLAIRRYGQWWQRARCEPLGPEGRLRIGSRFRLEDTLGSHEIEVAALRPWRRIDLRYVAGDLLGPASWEFLKHRSATLVRYAYRGVEANTDAMRQRCANGRGLQSHGEAMQRDVFPEFCRTLEGPDDVSGADLFEAVHSLRSVRHFRADPVPDAVLRHILEAATRAPSARNVQPWFFLAVRDPPVKRALAALYLTAWQRARRYTAQVDADADICERPDYAPMMRAVDWLATHLDRVPVIVLALLDTAQLGTLADEHGTIVAPQSAYASIFPAVQNLMLAARGLGVGSTLTTVYASVEADMRAVLGIPPTVHIASLIPLGYPRRPFRVTRRKSLDEVVFLDRWGGKMSDQ